MNVIDESALEMLRELDPDDPAGFVRKIVEVFLNQSRPDIQTLESALSAGNADEVMKLAHKTKSGARSVGAMILGDQAEALEKAAKEGQPLPALRASADTLLQAYREAEAELKRITGL